MIKARSNLTVQSMTSRARPGRKSCRASFLALALALASLPAAASPAASWPDSGPLYLSVVSHHATAEISVAGTCEAAASFHRDWGASLTRKGAFGDQGVCVRLATAVDAVRVTPNGGSCDVRPGLAASRPTPAVTLTPSSPAATFEGCSVGEAGAAAATAYGGITVEFADGYTWSSSFHGAMPDLVQDNAPGTPVSGAGSHSYRYQIDLHLPSVEQIIQASSAVHVAGPVALVDRPLPPVVTAPLAPTPAPVAQTSSVSQSTPAEKVPAPKAAAPTSWGTTDGMKLRAQISQWVEQANAVGCGAIDNPCYRVAERKATDPVEPWRVRISTSFPGDLLTALTSLRDGFWQDPRPDIEVTRNNVIILRRLGAP